MSGDTRPRRAALPVLAAVLGLALGGGAGWAAREASTPPPPLPSTPAFTVTSAQQGVVERSISLDAKATWSSGTSVLGGPAGTVTATYPVQHVDVGTRLFDVDLAPVVAAQGEVPFFRDLAVGAQGDDVRQLHRFLRDAGYRPGPVRGTFDTRTEAAVKAWQKDLRTTVTGRVAKGVLVAVPSLPLQARLVGVAVGRPTPQGEPVLVAIPTAPTFTITLPTEQSRLVRQGMTVTFPEQDGWSATITTITPGTESATAVLGARDGAEARVCADTCEQVPNPAGGVYPARIQIVPRTSGVQVPTQALVVAPAGTAAVVDERGTNHPVTIKATAGGLAIVTGVDAGTRIRVPTTTPAG